MIEKEITELQRHFLAVDGEAVSLFAYPQLPVEDLPLEINRLKPDVLHISAHGDTNELELANADGMLVKLTGEMLVAFLNFPKAPRLVYLNSCNSEQLAAHLVEVVDFAIGTTQPISNRTARASALLFYDRLLTGATIENAYLAGRASIKALQDASSTLHVRKGANEKTERLHLIPQLVAKFEDDEFEPSKHGAYFVEIGLFGCPANTSQVVFFTDDESFISDDDEDDEEDDEEVGEEVRLACDLCRVVRGGPIRSTVWCYESGEYWGDFRGFATAVDGAGHSFSVSSTLCEALEAYFRVFAEDVEPMPEGAREAIARLRKMDGARGPSYSVDDSKAHASVDFNKKGKSLPAKASVAKTVSPTKKRAAKKARSAK